MKINQAPLQTATITPLLWRDLTEDAKRVVTRAIPNTVFEYEKQITRDYYDSQRERHYYKGDMYRNIALCQYGTIQVECRYADRDKVDMDKAAVKFLAPFINRMVEEKLIMPVVFSEPFKISLSLIDNEGNIYERVEREGTLFNHNEWRCMPLNTAYFAAKHLQSIGEGEDKDQELINKYEKIYTDEDVADCTYRVLYCVYVFPTKKFKKLAESTSPYLEEQERVDAMPEDYNRYLGEDLFVWEGQLPNKIIKLTPEVPWSYFQPGQSEEKSIITIQFKEPKP